MKTTFSRRELYALGEPIGNGATTKKLGGGRIYGMGGGGGGPNQTTSYQTNIPEYAKPYVETMLSATQKQLFQGTPTDDGGFNITGFQPYKSYGGTYAKAGEINPGTGKPYEGGEQTSYDPGKGIAGFQPMQEAAQRGVAGMQMPGEYGSASDATQRAMMNAQNMGYQAGNFGNQFQDPGAYQAGQFSMGQAQAPQLQNYQMQGPQDVQSQQFGQQAAQQYMSPYMQSVVDVQQREAQRQADIAGTQRGAQAVKSGAFGGSRQAIMEAEAARNLAQQKGDIQAQGLQGAFGQAQQQYNADQAQRMQAALANQGMGYNVGSQNLAANLGIQQLGSGQNLQAQLANQQMLQAAQQAQEQSRQFGANQGMTAAQQRAQYGLAGQQLGEQSRQYGANFGLQANQAAQQAAAQLASLGGQRFKTQQDIYNLQNQFGSQQQQLEQQKLNQAMQDYANAQQYPLMQLGTMSNMIRGLPMQASTTQQYQAQPNLLTQGIGAIGAGTSLYNAFNPQQKGGAAGGLPSEFKYSKGGGIMSYDMGGEVESDLESASDEFLNRQVKESSSTSIKRMAQRILRERQMSKGPGLAGGGIIAFAKGSKEAVVAPADDEETRRAQGILMAAPKATPSENPTIVPDVAPLPQQAVQAAPPPPAPLTREQTVQASNVPAELKTMFGAAQTESARPISDFAKELETEYKAAGVEQRSPEERANLMKERANAEDEAHRQRYLRMAEMFAAWGSTPGPTLAAGLAAFKNSVPSLISDEKEATKIRKEIDKSLAGLDESIRLEKRGLVDKAAERKTAAVKKMEDIYTDVVKFKTKEVEEERANAAQEKRDLRTREGEEAKDIRYANLQKEVTQMKIDADAKNNKMLADFRAADKAEAGKDRLITLYRGAQSDIASAESRIQNIMKSPEYQDALANSKETITKESGKAAVKMRDDAVEALKGFNESFKAQREAVDSTVKFMEDRLNAKGVPLPAKKPKGSDKPPPLPPGAKLD
jgi:hypothetical protein